LLNINRGCVARVVFLIISSCKLSIKILWHIDCTIEAQNKGKRKMAFNVSEIAKATEWTLLQLDEAAHNLANVTTTGFKAEHLYNVTNEMKAQKKDNINQMLLTPVHYFRGTREMDLSQGTMEKTSNQFDMAIEQNGFLQFDNNGNTVYSRSGALKIDKDGSLVNSNGLKLIPSITIPSGSATFTIDNGGTWTAADNKGVSLATGRLQLATFTNPSGLTSIGRNLYEKTDFSGDAVAGNPGENEVGKISQYYLENSNVNAIREMVDMIALQRSFETYQKTIQTLADLDKISTNRIGKLI
jgi:flagellar basal-body rod protein FlgG